MACNQRGMTLASVLFLLALLMVMALVLTEKVQQATRAAALGRSHARARDAAAAGIAWGRRQLAANYAASDCWQEYLASAPDTGGYPAAPAFTLTLNGHDIALFVRDNPDGDHDWQHDNDLQLYLLARLPAKRAPEILIEALCGFTANHVSDDYPQLMWGTPPAGLAAEPGTSSDFQVTD